MLKILKFIPTQLTICLVLGILFGCYFFISPNTLTIFLVCLSIAFIAVYLYANKKFETNLLFTFTTYLLAFCIGIASITFKNEQHKNSFYANQQSFSENEPQTAIVSIQKTLKESNYSEKYVGEILQLNTQKSSGKILINIKKDSLEAILQVGDKIVVKTIFNEISKPKNPYEFNYKNYLKNQQIHFQIYLNKSDYLLLKKETTITSIAANTRNHINNELLKNGFKGDELGVIDALLLGQRKDISSDLLQSYTNAGAIHILAVSGLHIGILLLILIFLFQPLNNFKHGKTIASVCVIILLWLFAILAGLSASVVRAVTMFTAVAIGMYSNRASNVYHTIIISMFFLLLFNPFYLFDVGFQLSYLAVFSIVYIQPKLYKLWHPKIWVVDKIWQLFTVSLAAQLGVLPLSLFYFHQFPGLFFVSNLVIIPFLGIILGVGILLILLAILNILPTPFAIAYSFVIEQMNNFINWVSSHQLFIIENISFSFALLCSFYALLFFILKWTEKQNFKRAVLLFFSIIAIQTIFIFEKHQLQTTQNLIVFNKTAESMIANRMGKKLTIETSNINFSSTKNPLKTYLVGTGIDSVFSSTKIQNLHFYKNETILIVDSLGIYNFKKVKPTVVLLINSPKINLDRLLATLNPKLVIADGSNYKSTTLKWAESCVKHKTPFYNTMQNGAFILN
ncbi:ComEC family competence protein [Lutibacter sp. HS1-25]|uniref:ComEC/Rec2 family competence protein n=1 Tax=Lutibacter sp. HS1-25 TaxID=2485000 RepID=UPI0010133FCF|nr:ComEC/Rec2 family competence protein [Lutibacter sp. HS1-25]RXP45177.1 ComEC family competence protein [Lutibacter sp. HS1-25]